MTLQERIQTDPFIRNVGYIIVVTWAWLRICIIMGLAKPINPELGVQAISSTDSLMSFVAGYLYAGQPMRSQPPNTARTTEVTTTTAVAEPALEPATPTKGASNGTN